MSNITGAGNDDEIDDRAPVMEPSTLGDDVNSGELVADGTSSVPIIQDTSEKPKKNLPKLIAEIQATEQTYRENLKDCNELTIKIIKTFTIPKDVRDQFSRMQQIFDLSNSLYQEFIQNSEPDGVINALRKHHKYFALYQDYITAYPNFNAQILKLQNDQPKFKEFLAKEQQSTLKGHDLPSILILPIQRIPRYELLLREVAKQTPQDSQLHNDTENLLKSLTQITTNINKNAYIDFLNVADIEQLKALRSNMSAYIDKATDKKNQGVRKNIRKLILAAEAQELLKMPNHVEFYKAGVQQKILHIPTIPVQIKLYDDLEMTLKKIQLAIDIGGIPEIQSSQEAEGMQPIENTTTSKENLAGKSITINSNDLENPAKIALFTAQYQALREYGIKVKFSNPKMKIAVENNIINNQIISASKTQVEQNPYIHLKKPTLDELQKCLQTGCLADYSSMLQLCEKYKSKKTPLPKIVFSNVDVKKIPLVMLQIKQIADFNAKTGNKLEYSFDDASINMLNPAEVTGSAKLNVHASAWDQAMYSSIQKFQDTFNAQKLGELYNAAQQNKIMASNTNTQSVRIAELNTLASSIATIITSNTAPNSSKITGILFAIEAKIKEQKTALEPKNIWQKIARIVRPSSLNNIYDTMLKELEIIKTMHRSCNAPLSKLQQFQAMDLTVDPAELTAIHKSVFSSNSNKQNAALATPAPTVTIPTRAEEAQAEAAVKAAAQAAEQARIANAPRTAPPHLQ